MNQHSGFRITLPGFPDLLHSEVIMYSAKTGVKNYLLISLPGDIMPQISVRDEQDFLVGDCVYHLGSVSRSAANIALRLNRCCGINISYDCSLRISLLPFP